MATDNLKKVVLIITKSLSTGEEVFKDGWQFTDIFAFIPELSAIPEIVKNKAALGEEFKSLKSDPAGRKDLETFIETSLVLENKKTERIVEIVIEIGMLIFEAIDLLSVPKDPTL